MKHEAPAFITPLSITFPMDGRDMTVSAANVATLAAMMDTVAPVLEELVLLPAEMLARLTGDTGPTKADLVDLLQLLQRKAGAQAAIELVALGVGMPEAEAGHLLPDRFAYLFALVLQVNADFFGRALPVLAVAAAKLQALAPAPGATTSTTSGPASSAS
ncbi:MAG: hypothetical protein Q7U99_17580 [Rubrivivax sp.]|nr:hypothetical protein [Rubrivivax sp.]